MEIIVEVNGHWLAGAKRFPIRNEQYTRLLTNIGDIVAVGLNQSYGRDAELAGPPEVELRFLPKSLVGTRDFRITLRPPYIGNSLPEQKLYNTALQDAVVPALLEMFQEEVVELRIEPVLMSRVVISRGQRGSELGTFRPLGKPE